MTLHVITTRAMMRSLYPVIRYPTTTRILGELLANRGKLVLHDQLKGVAWECRTIVSVHITKLRKLGWKIESRPTRGYVLTGHDDEA